jgi:hypothetical protein
MSLRKGTDQAVSNSSGPVCDFQKLVGFLGVQITEALGDTNLTCVSTSSKEPRACPIDWINSPRVIRPAPSAMLLGTETAARRTWLVSP